MEGLEVRADAGVCEGWALWAPGGQGLTRKGCARSGGGEGPSSALPEPPAFLETLGI